jgi:hypothetical protein
MEKVCIQCSKVFILKSSTSGKFCSAKCWYEWPGKKPLKICPICKKEFRRGHSSKKYCSVECGNVGKRTAKRNTNCAFCNKQLKSNCHPRVRFCSKSCATRSHPHELYYKPEGSKAKHSAGYYTIKINGNWVLEHRYIMEQFLGRTLEPHERVHHKNGQRNDNRPENLELWKIKKKDPAGVRASDYHCAGCICFNPRN